MVSIIVLCVVPFLVSGVYAWVRFDELSAQTPDYRLVYALGWASFRLIVATVVFLIYFVTSLLRGVVAFVAMVYCSLEEKLPDIRDDVDEGIFRDSAGRMPA